MAALTASARLNRYRGPRYRWCITLLVVCPLIGQLAGCARPVIDLFDAPEAPTANSTRQYDDSDWTLTLRENVKAGLVDYRHLAEHPESLDAYATLLRTVGPQSTPAQFREPGADLAYYINAYNACVLRAVLRAGVPHSMHHPLLPNLETGYRFWVDGAPRTLLELHQRAGIAARKNARVEFALGQAANNMPALPREPFRAFDVFDRLHVLAKEAMSNKQLVYIDHTQAALLLTPAIWDHQADFKATYCRETGSDSATMLNCLMHLADAKGRENLVRATGYAIRPQRSNGGLNQWRPRPKHR